MREHCDVCGGLGAQVEVRPWNSAERVCEQGHRWFTSPVPGTEHPLPRRASREAAHDLSQSALG